MKTACLIRARPCFCQPRKTCALGGNLEGGAIKSNSAIKLQFNGGYVGDAVRPDPTPPPIYI